MLNVIFYKRLKRQDYNVLELINNFYFYFLDHQITIRKYRRKAMGLLYDSITTLVSFTGWSVLFLCMCLLDRKRHYTWHFNIIVLIHGIVAIVLSGYSAFIQGPWPFTNSGKYSHAYKY